MSHFDKLVHLPEGFVRIASTKNTEFAGIAHQSKPIFGLFSALLLNYSYPNKQPRADWSRWQESSCILRFRTRTVVLIYRQLCY